jgi:hypothetical protein
MKALSYLIGAALVALPAAASAQDEDPREAARKMTEQSMAKALAEKARNDAIVEKQREAERAAKAKAAKPTPTPPKGVIQQ